MADTKPLEAEAGRFQKHLQALRAEVGKVIVGQEEVVDATLTAIMCGGNVLLEGVPGLGKTMLVKTLSQAMDLEFRRIQFTPDLMPADIIGTTVMNADSAGHYRFEFRRGPIFTQLLLADEINRATPKTQSALLEAMQERTVSVARTTHELPEPFLVLATQNPLEMEGTYPLPEAQVDRFLLKITVDSPSAEELVEVMTRTTGADDPAAEPAADAERIQAMRRLVREVLAASHVMDYIARLIRATHPGAPDAPEPVRKYVRYGASPRGAQAVLLAAKVRALRAGRANVAFEDIAPAVGAALRHRLILSFEGQADGVEPDEILRAVTEYVPREP